MGSLVYGLDKELAEKAQAKYDPQREMAARKWIEEVVGETLPDADFHESLKDGIYLCKLINAAFPGSIKYSDSKLPFKQMENINTFLTFAEKMGCPRADLFQTVDLYEKKNMNQVVDAIYSFSRHINKKGYTGPLLGPKLADKHEVHFTDEQLRQGKVIPSGQMGYNKGANQSGMSYSSKREIDSRVGAGADEPSQQNLGGRGSYDKDIGSHYLGIQYGARRDILNYKPSP